MAPRPRAPHVWDIAERRTTMSRLCIAFVFVLGCSSSSSGSSSADVSTELVGHWASDTCEATPSAGGQTHYVKREYTFTKDTIAFNFTLFAEPSCATKLMKVDLGGDYTLDSTTVPGARGVDFHVASRALTAYAPDMANAFGQAHCGAAPWTPGATQDITAAGCAVIGYGALDACPTQYDLVKLDGARLFLGVRQNDVDACKAEDRPVQVQTVAVVKT
jgi:hypothetical protein